MDCPKNKEHKVVLIEYSHDMPEHYDGISEINCLDCHKRYGRWSKRELLDGQLEPRFGGEYV